MLLFGLSRSAQADREPQTSAPRGPRFPCGAGRQAVQSALGRPGGETLPPRFSLRVARCTMQKAFTGLPVKAFCLAGCGFYSSESAGT